MLVIAAVIVGGIAAICAPARAGVGMVQSGERFVREALAAGEATEANKRYVSSLGEEWVYLTEEETGKLHTGLTMASVDGMDSEAAREALRLLEKGLRAYKEWEASNEGQ